MKAIQLFAIGSLSWLAFIAQAGNTIWTPHGETEFVGRAIDKTTGRPVPGASILATYILGSGGVHESAHCSFAEFVQANDKGEYVLPFYDGLPPQYLAAFAHRYEWTVWGRVPAKDIHLRWVVNITKVIDGKNQIVGTEGPFRNEQQALKASRELQDVWLEPFTGGDDEWLQIVSHTAAEAGPGCPSRRSAGLAGWERARLAEALSMPDSPTRRQVVKQLSAVVEYLESRNPDSPRRTDPEAGR